MSNVHFYSLMDSKRLKQIEEIYHAAAEIPPDERESFFTEHCGADVELRREVESLLAFEKSSSNFIDSPPESLIAEMICGRDVENLAGSSVGHYKILSLLGEGGMGAVYLAQDEKLLRKVALKILPAEIVKDENRVHRFVHEARSASALNHPNILTIYAIDQIENLHFIAMEFVDGDTLHEAIYRRKSDLKSLIKYLAQTADGLAKAHQAGIIHRDLKPENIMITSDGYAKILDFGLAKLVESETGLQAFQRHKSIKGVIMGTPGYMSPEQAQGKPEIDQRSDIFSFGCILYEAVAGRKPFTADSAIDALHKIIYDEPPQIKNISAELQEIIGKCLRKNADERFRTIREVAARLRSLNITTNEQPRLDSEDKTVLLESAYSTKTISKSFSEQRRQATILFADVSALNEILEESEPEEASEILNDLWERLNEIIAANGGQSEKHLSDTFVAFWGANEISEQDPEQAIRTALALQAEAQNFIKTTDFFVTNPQVQPFLKIGISTGTILFGQSTDTGEFKATGAAVNQAKRLHRHAPPGGILISHDTYRYVRGVFDVAEFEPKNEAGATKIYEVKRAKPRAFRVGNRGVEGIETQMIGRDGELKRILDALAAVIEDKETQAVTIVAEAGLGKSRLLYEFINRIELMPDLIRVFNARATRGASGSAYSLVRDVFSFRFEILESDSKETAREKFVKGIAELIGSSTGDFAANNEAEMKTHFIGHLLGFDFSESAHIKKTSGDFKQIRDRALLYAAQLFCSITEKFPLVVYLDDLHWADDGSLDFFDSLMQNCRASSVLFLEFTRPTLFERRPHWGEGQKNRLRLDLQPLTRRESRELVSNILQKVEKTPAELRDLIVSNAEGNPFYVEELIKMLIEQGAITTRENVWSVDENQLGEINVPPTLSGVLQARLDRLTVWEKTVLQRASVIGREFWETALENFDAKSSVKEALESLRRKELLYRRETSAFADTTEYLFKHALLHDVTYQTVLLRERRELHEKFAEWLIESSGERGESNAPNIAEHFQKARNFDQAADWFGRAGNYAVNVHAPALAVVYYRQALKFLASISTIDADEKQSKIISWNKSLGRALWLEVKFAEAVETFKLTIAEADKAGDNLSKAQALYHLSIVLFEQGDNFGSLESARGSEKAARAAGTDEVALEVLAAAIFRQSRAHYSLAEFAETIECGKKSLKIAEGLSENGMFVRGQSFHMIAFSYIPLGDFENAIHYQNLSLEVAREAGYKINVAYALSNLGVIYDIRGDAEKAYQFSKVALPIMSEVGNKSGLVVIHGNCAGALVELGRFDEAKEHLDKVLELMGDSKHFVFPEVYQDLARCFLAQGFEDKALEAIRISLNAAEESKSPEFVGEAWRVLGEIAARLQKSVVYNDKEFTAPECFMKSLRIFDEIKMEIERAQTLKSYARHEFTGGDKNRAEKLMNQAGEIFERLKINIKAEF